MSSRAAWPVAIFAAGIVRLALWPARLALALGATLMAAQALADLFAVAAPRR